MQPDRLPAPHPPGGDELYLHRYAHLVVAEVGGAAALAGAMVAHLDGDGGFFDGAALEAALRDPSDRHQPRSRLVSIEQTTNVTGGRVWPGPRRAGRCLAWSAPPS